MMTKRALFNPDLLSHLAHDVIQFDKTKVKMRLMTWRALLYTGPDLLPPRAQRQRRRLCLLDGLLALLNHRHLHLDVRRRGLPGVGRPVGPHPRTGVRLNWSIMEASTGMTEWDTSAVSRTKGLKCQLKQYLGEAW